METRNWIGIASAVGAAAIAGGTYWRYRHDMSDRAKSLKAKSSIARTAKGEIEYAREGSGPAALVIHGAGGGFDQGLYLAHDLLGEGYDVIAPSRFGYLRTPLPTDASHKAQAEAHAALLDKLGVEDPIVMGVSAGGPSAIEFAVRYPERTRALILVVPRAYDPANQVGVEQTPQNKVVIKLFENSADFSYWAATKVGRKQLVRFFGVDPELEATAAPEEREKISGLIADMLPLSARVEGIIADTCSELVRPDLEKIDAPTLVISAEDDLYHTLPGARFAAEHIPNAELKVFKSGGHLLIGHGEDTRRAINAFLARYTDTTEAVPDGKVGQEPLAMTH
ncbi:MAG: alpha/beta fold hydrolase [Sphingomonadaceae bacterium]|jgi:2-hydroxy-6-oxonona-2,4-dienedioate hydrolase